MHGAVVLFVTFHWERLRFVVPYLAWLHVAFGCAMFAVDLDAGLPWWWVAGEGPSLVGFAMVVLAVNRRARLESGIRNHGRRQNPLSDYRLLIPDS
jgi:hypothetical protein